MQIFKRTRVKRIQPTQQLYNLNFGRQQKRLHSIHNHSLSSFLCWPRKLDRTLLEEGANLFFPSFIEQCVGINQQASQLKQQQASSTHNSLPSIWQFGTIQFHRYINGFQNLIWFFWHPSYRPKGILTIKLLQF